MIWQRKNDATETAPAFLPGSPAAQIVPEPGSTESDVVIEKIAMSALEREPV